MPQTLFEYGGAGTPVHMALANGFPPETYQPLLQPLTGCCRVLSLPPRPLWDTPPPPQTVRTWEDTAADLLAGLEAYDLRGVIGIGHSLGAVATMLAAVQQPERFRGIVLLDPPIFPPIRQLRLGVLQALGLHRYFPMVQKANRRRDHFASVDEAFAYWRGKRLFNDWSDEVLRLYAQGLTCPNASGVTLRWSREWEARYYATIYTKSWRVVPQLEGLLPVLVIRGTNSSTFFEDAAALMRQRVPSMTYAEIEGHGHLFPQSAPDATCAVIEDWLAAL